MQVDRRFRRRPGPALRRPRLRAARRPGRRRTLQAQVWRAKQLVGVDARSTTLPRGPERARGQVERADRRSTSLRAGRLRAASWSPRTARRSAARSGGCRSGSSSRRAHDRLPRGGRHARRCARAARASSLAAPRAGGHRPGRRGRPAGSAAGGGLPPGGRERRAGRGGLPAHAPHGPRLARVRRRADAAPARRPARATSAGRRACTSTGRTTRAPTTTPTSSPPRGSRTARSTTGRLREMLRNEIRYTNALDGIPADLDLAVGQARAAEPLRRGRVREGRPHRDHRAPRPHAVVLPDVRHDGRPHEARAGARATSARCPTPAPS